MAEDSRIWGDYTSSILWYPFFNFLPREKNASLIIVDRDFPIHLSYDHLEGSVYHTFVEQHEAVQALNKFPLQGKMQRRMFWIKIS